MSPTAKSVVASLAVKVKDKVTSLEAPPSVTSADVIVIVGAVVSNLAATLPAALITAVPAFGPVAAVSLKATLKVISPDVSLALTV